MATIALEREANDYWALIKNASAEVKLSLISKLSNSLISHKSKSKHKVTASDFAGMWPDTEFPDATEMAKEIRDARHFPDRMESYL